MLHDDRILSEAHKWKQILARIIHVVVFLGERGLYFRGSSQRIGDIHNGNFLGLIELLAHYDRVLSEHVTKIQVSQEKGETAAHYLSAASQNEFIGLCAEYVRSRVLDEIDDAKYYSIMVDATPDSSHVEQTTFIIRYLTRELQEFFVQEHFLTFVDCFWNFTCRLIMLQTCLADIMEPNSTSLLKTPRACNLCGADSAACCKEAVTFFAQLPGIHSALEQLHTLNLTPKTATEVNGAVKYISSFTCILMSTRQATIDVEVSNLKSLVNDLKNLRKQQISTACVTLAKQYNNDISQDEKMVHLKAIHGANFGDESLSPFSLLKKISKFKLAEIFPNVCIALRIFCTLPFTVASAERSFSKLKLIKNFLRSTMTQDRLNDLAILGIESDLTGGPCLLVAPGPSQALGGPELWGRVEVSQDLLMSFRSARSPTGPSSAGRVLLLILAENSCASLFASDWGSWLFLWILCWPSLGKVSLF
ncbi:uncharacterized protein LOC119572557 [Penaeus monodon]|uniref:uncharacterized protein LOC119572557 n=1 Tax=Penaeus monodon TaxID=6687 RepID=UPI0018A7AB30|nr:uncharacterized protein LOC119572557 [Penaeus monodon]